MAIYRRFLVTLLVAAIATFAARGALAVDYSWSGASGGLWTDSGNWTSSGGTYPSSIADTTTFNNGGSAQTINLDASQTVARFSVGYVTNATNKTGNVVLNDNGSSTMLTVGDTSTGGLIHVGSSWGGATINDTATGNPTGTLTLESGTTLSLVGGALYVGSRQGSLNASVPVGGNATGALNLVSGATLNVGTLANRSLWELGQQRCNRNGVVSKGTFSATGGDLTAYLSLLTIGRNIRGGNETTGNKGQGDLDLTNLQSALIDTNRLEIGYTNVGAAQGTMTIGNNHSVSVGDNSTAGMVLIGVSDSSSSASGSGTNQINGTLTMNAGSSLTIGTPTQDASLTIGRNLGVRGTTINRVGDLTANGGTFAAYLSSLTVGSQEATAGGKTYSADGTLDLRNATVTAFEVSGDVTIGYSSGSAAGSKGDVYLPDVAGSIGGSLTVGDSDSGSSGLLDLDGTTLAIGDGTSATGVAIGPTGEIITRVSGSSAGLDLAQDAFLSIATGGDLNLIFNDPLGTTPRWGLRAVGDRVSELLGLIGNGITITNNMTGGKVISVYNDTAYTYIGVVPEPSTWVALLGFAGMGLLGYLRRRRR